MPRLKRVVFLLIAFAFFLFLGASTRGAEDSLRIIYTGNTLSNLVPSG